MPQLSNVEICQALSVGPADYVSPAMDGHLRVNSMFISANIRKAIQEGRGDFTPVLLSEFRYYSSKRYCHWMSPWCMSPRLTSTASAVWESKSG